MGLILSLGTFCPLGRFAPGTFCPLGRYIFGTLCPWDVLSLGTFCPWNLMSEDVLSWDVLYVHHRYSAELQQCTILTENETKNRP